MNTKQIKAYVLKRQQAAAKAYMDIKAVQDEVCPHEGLEGKYGGSSGNYDPSCDSYWVDFKCSVCGKRWTEDQDQQRYLGGKNTSKAGFHWAQVKDFT